MHYPGLDLKSLTTEELTDRMVKCRERYAMAQHNPALAQNVRMVLDAIEFEYQERIQMERIEKDNEKNPAGAKTIGEIEDITNKDKK